jgi:hypothetical protein
MHPSEAIQPRYFDGAQGDIVCEMEANNKDAQLACVW